MTTHLRRIRRAACAMLALLLALGAVPALANEGATGLIAPVTSGRLVSESMFIVNSTGTHVVTPAALNVRTGPNDYYPVCDIIHRGDKVQVVAILGTFCRIVSTTGVYGYVSRQYLDPIGAATPTPTAAPTGRQVYRVTASALNVRTGPSTGYSVLTLIYSGDEIYKLADVNASWMRIQLRDGRIGYIMNTYATYVRTEGGAVPTQRPTATPTVRPTSRPTATPTPPPIPTTGLGPGDIYVTTANVNLRSGPSTGYASKRVLSNGTYVTLYSKYSNSWYYIRTTDGIYGYMSSQYLRYVKTVTSTPQPTSGIVDTSEQIYSYQQMLEDINALYNRYPSQVTRRVAIGDTMWSQQIPAVCIGNVNASKALLIDGGIHGREYMSTLLIMRQMEYLLDNQNSYYNGHRIGDMLEECCIWFVPMINPDGVRISQTGLAGLSNTQKNNLIAMNGGSTYFTRWKANGYGVDLNRNFDAGWVYQGKPSGSEYSGAWANSESETQAMVNFVKNHTNIKASINYHTTGNCIYWHYGQTGAAKTRDKKIADKLSQLTGYYLRDENYSGKGGGFMDWMIASRGLPSFTLELGPGSENAPQSIARFNAIWSANRNVPAFMLAYIIDNL